MRVNKPVIISSLVIMAVGVVRAWTSNPPQGITKVVVGGYMLMLFLSVFDLIPGVSGVVSAIALLALVAAILTEGIPIFQQLGTTTIGQSAPTTPGSSTTVPTPNTPGGALTNPGVPGPGVNPNTA